MSSNCIEVARQSTTVDKVGMAYIGMVMPCILTSVI